MVQFDQPIYQNEPHLVSDVFLEGVVSVGQKKGLSCQNIRYGSRAGRAELVCSTFAPVAQLPVTALRNSVLVKGSTALNQLLCLRFHNTCLESFALLEVELLLSLSFQFLYCLLFFIRQQFNYCFFGFIFINYFLNLLFHFLIFLNIITYNTTRIDD